MSEITVLRPDESPQPSGSVEYAKRRTLPEDATVIIIDNGKPRARDLMQYVAEELQQRHPIGSIEVFSKVSAGKPVEPEQAKEMAARAHMVITGVGD